MSRVRSPQRVLVVEDDRTLARLLARHLEGLGHLVSVVHAWREVESAVRGFAPSLILLDDRLPDANALKQVPALLRHAPVIVVTAFASTRHAVAAMRLGATEYLAKPVNPDELEFAIERAIERGVLHTRLAYATARLQDPAEEVLVGTSDACRRLVAELATAAESDRPVLIEGEIGTGKERVARRLHRASRRADGCFVPVAVGTDPPEALAARLFGGSGPDGPAGSAVGRGLVEIAEGGTLYLEEVAAFDPELQNHLRRLLETGRFRRPGETLELAADTRLVAGTSRDPRALAAAGRLDPALLARLDAHRLRVPPLRERLEDVPLIAAHLLRHRGFLLDREKRLSAAAEESLTRYAWPGNLRELKAVVERAVLVSGDAPLIEPEHLGLERPAVVARGRRVELVFDHEPSLEEIRAAYLTRLLDRHRGHRAKVAEILGISERNLYRLLRQQEAAGELAEPATGGS